jgi:integrase
MRHFIEAVGDIDCQRVEHQHGERFLQACLDRSNTLATAQKKIKALKRVFQLAVLRGQLDTNPFRYLQCRKLPEKEIHIYTLEECRRMLKAGTEDVRYLNWKLLISLALTTGMRRGELLNVVWSDVDFEKQTIRVAPKRDTGSTWEWRIKDSERRILPLTNDAARELIEHQVAQPEGYPYVFVSVPRYERIQERRRQGRWTLSDGRCPVNNFTRHFEKLQARANVDQGEFHDLRRTCITRWFENGLSEFEVMKLAGHSDFQTTHRFYLAIRRDLVDRARRASDAAMRAELGTNLAQAPYRA